MKEKLTQFLTQLTTDIDLEELFRNEPEKTMLSYGLDDESIKLVLNHEYDEIRVLLGDDFEISTNSFIGAYKHSESILKDRFARFLNELVHDLNLVNDFKQDPVYTMRHFGLTQRCIDLVLNKDFENIQIMLGANYQVHPNNIVKAFKIEPNQKLVG